MIAYRLTKGPGKRYFRLPAKKISIAYENILLEYFYTSFRANDSNLPERLQDKTSETLTVLLFFGI